MKINSLIKYCGSFIALLIAISMAGCGKQDEAPKTENKDSAKVIETKKVEIPTSAHIVFDVTGDRVGTDDAYMTGKKFLQVMNVKIGGVMKKITLISDGTIFYLISESGGKKIGIKMPLDSSKDFTLKKSPGEDFEDLVSRLNSFPTVGSEVILDKKCDLKITPHKDTMAVYEGFPLKANFRSKGFYMIATKFEPNPKITDDMFVPPSGVEFIDFSMLRRR